MSLTAELKLSYYSAAMPGRGGGAAQNIMNWMIDITPTLTRVAFKSRVRQRRVCVHKLVC